MNILLNLICIGFAVWGINYLTSLREEIGPNVIITFGIVANWLSGLLNTFAVLLSIVAYYHQ